MLWRFLKTLLRRVEPQGHSNRQSSAGVRVWQSSWQELSQSPWCGCDVVLSWTTAEGTERYSCVQSCSWPNKLWDVTKAREMRNEHECSETEREISNHRFLGRIEMYWISGCRIDPDLARLICWALWASPKFCHPGRVAAGLSRSQLGLHQCCSGTL